MAKKNKKNLKQLIAKKQQLQALQQGRSAPILPSVTPAAVALPSPVVTESAKALPAFTINREIWRTLISTAIIAAVLVSVIVLNTKKPFLDRFGDQIYQSLHLDR